MLTPTFELSQDADFLYIIIKAPFAKVSETEIFIEENDFRFYSKPYFLRLNLPGNIVEDGRETAKYDGDTGQFHVHVAKETPGEKFEGLDMLTRLLAPKGQTSVGQPKIEVLDGDCENYDDEDTDDTEFDWFIEQVPYAEATEPVCSGYKYGFANLRQGEFQRIQSDLHEVVDVKDPDNVSYLERRQQREEQEETKFDEDHYIADLYEDETVQHFIQYESPWQQEMREVQKGISVETVVQFTEEEKEIMLKLPRKEYLIEESTLASVYLGLVDIIFAYAYNHRTTEGESTVESGWTVCKLSSQLSWFETFSSICDVVKAAYRRSLTFPLYRNWHLAQAVLQDTTNIFQFGKRRILKCLLEVNNILKDTDGHYILNDLYVTDYCVWVQSASDKKIKSLADALKQINLQKTEIGLNLVEVESTAKSMMEEEEMSAVTKSVSALTVEQTQDTTDSDDTTDTDSDDDSTESDDESTSSGNASSEVKTGSDENLKRDVKHTGKRGNHSENPGNKVRQNDDEKVNCRCETSRTVTSNASENIPGCMDTAINDGVCLTSATSFDDSCRINSRNKCNETSENNDNEKVT